MFNAVGCLAPHPDDCQAPTSPFYQFTTHGTDQALKQFFYFVESILVLVRAAAAGAGPLALGGGCLCCWRRVALTHPRPAPAARPPQPLDLVNETLPAFEYIYEASGPPAGGPLQLRSGLGCDTDSSTCNGWCARKTQVGNADLFGGLVMMKDEYMASVRVSMARRPPRVDDALRRTARRACQRARGVTAPCGRAKAQRCLCLRRWLRRWTRGEAGPAMVLRT